MSAGAAFWIGVLFGAIPTGVIVRGCYVRQTAEWRAKYRKAQFNNELLRADRARRTSR